MEEGNKYVFGEYGMCLLLILKKVTVIFAHKYALYFKNKSEHVT